MEHGTEEYKNAFMQLKSIIEKRYKDCVVWADMDRMHVEVRTDDGIEYQFSLSNTGAIVARGQFIYRVQQLQSFRELEKYPQLMDVFFSGVNEEMESALKSIKHSPRGKNYVHIVRTPFGIVDAFYDVNKANECLMKCQASSARSDEFYVERINVC